MHPTLSILTALLLPLAAEDEKNAARPSEPVVLRATGIGKPPAGKPATQGRLMARRAAEVVALRNLAAQLQGQQVKESEGTIHATTEGLLRGHRFLPPKELPDGTVEVTVELPLPQLHINHAELVERLGRAEAELRATRARLDAARQRHTRVQAALEARVTAVERELNELRRLLDELKAAAQENAGDESSAQAP